MTIRTARLFSTGICSLLLTLILTQPAVASEPVFAREISSVQVWDPIGTIDGVNPQPDGLMLIPGDRLLEQGLFQDYRVYDLQGQLMWQFDMPDETGMYHCVAPDGTIYIGTNKNNVYAIAPDYTVKWKFYAQGSRDWVACPQVGPDGNIYVAAQGGVLYGLAPDGSQLWRAEPGVSGKKQLVISPTGRMFTTSSSSVVALDMQGRELWRSAPESGLKLWLLPGKPEVLVCEWYKENRLVGLSLDGTELWRLENIDLADFTAVYSANDMLYLPVNTVTPEQVANGKCAEMGYEWIAVNTRGEMVWRHACSGLFPKACTLPDGRTVIADAFLPAHPIWDWITNAVIWLGGGTAMLVVLDKSGAVESETFLPFILPMANPVALPDGTVLVVGENGKLYRYEVPKA